MGGLETHVSNICERMADKHDVTVFTTDPSGKLKREEVVNGVLVRRFKVFAPGNAYFISFALLGACRKSKYDILHAHNYHALPLFCSQFSQFRKFIVTPHYHGHGSTLFRDSLLKLYKPFGGKVLKIADTIVSVSDYERRLILRDFKLDKEKTIEIPNGVEWKEFQGLIKEKDSETSTILYVARLEHYKGIQFAISALPLLSDNIHLDIVGDGSYKRELVQLSERLRVKHRINFYQNLERNVLIQKYYNADLVLLLSKYEGYGTVVAEALATGTPCIVTNTSALTQWIDNNNCFGIDYPIKIEQLAVLINKVIGKAVEGVNLWDWDDVAKQLELLYLK
jgi:glycosyltransferase involved in cell wall biosynthesis